jgi:superfamily II DNA or RNA helicase
LIPHLRDYQKKAVEQIRSVSREHQQLIWTGATGSGKTIIGADITRKANDKKKRVLWLVHREEIADQTVKKLITFGIQPGIIQGSNYMRDSLTHVAMVQSLAHRLDFMKNNNLLPDVIISDECHHGTANTWQTIYRFLKSNKKHCSIIGLTATSARTDGVGLNIAGYTALIQGPQYADLINPQFTGGEIHLSEPVVFYSPLTFKLQSAKSKKKNKDYDPNAEEIIFGEKIVVNNCCDLYEKYFFSAPAIIFCASVSDCMTVTAAMRSRGWKGGAIYDQMDKEERKDFIQGLGDGRYNFLCSYDILGEGVDIPVTAGSILRRRTTSIIIYLQEIGRSARRYPGKKYNLIIDQCGNSIIHGHPLTRRNWTLEGIDKQPSDESLKMTVCFSCGALLAGRPSECPYCGAVLKSENPTEKILEEVEAPMSVLPAPAQTGYSDISEIEEFEVSDREQAIIDRIQSGQMTSFDRFGELARMIGKDRKWTDLVWRKYHG